MSVNEAVMAFLLKIGFWKICHKLSRDCTRLAYSTWLALAIKRPLYAIPFCSNCSINNNSHHGNRKGFQLTALCCSVFRPSIIDHGQYQNVGYQSMVINVILISNLLPNRNFRFEQITFPPIDLPSYYPLISLSFCPSFQ